MLSQGIRDLLPGSPSDHRVPLFPPQETMPVLHMMSVRRPSSLLTRTQVPRPCSMPMPGSPGRPSLVNQAADDRRLP